MSSFGYHFQHHPSTASSGNRSRRNPHRPSSTKSFQMMRPKEELTDIPAVPTFIEKFEAGRSFEMEDDFAFIPELCTEEEVWGLLSGALIYAYLFHLLAASNDGLLGFRSFIKLERITSVIPTTTPSTAFDCLPSRCHICEHVQPQYAYEISSSRCAASKTAQRHPHCQPQHWSASRISPSCIT